MSFLLLVVFSAVFTIGQTAGPTAGPTLDTDELGATESLRREALRQAEQKYGPDDKMLAPALTNLALALHAQARDAEAEPFARRSFLIAEQSGDRRLMGATLNGLGVVLAGKGDKARAEPVLRRSVAILEEGMTWESLGMTAQDAQFVESRKISPVEICQFFRMPPHKVQILDRSTNNNIEQQSLDFLGDTLLPWLVKFEQSANRDLLQTKAEQAGMFFKFDVSELLRADIKTRFASYGIGLQNGFMNRNEVRQKEGWAPFPGGDEYLIQMNMGQGGANKNPQGDAPKPDPQTKDSPQEDKNEN